MAKKRLPLEINAVDFSAFVNRTAYSISYEDRIGPNRGFMLDGTETSDLIKRKAVIEWPLNDLPSDKLAQILTICEDEYVAVKFFDTKINAPRISVFMPNISPASCNIITQSGTYWFTGQVLTLRER